MEEKSILNAEVPEALRRAVKAQAALEGRTVSEFVADALRRAIDEIGANRLNQRDGAK